MTGKQMNLEGKVVFKNEKLTWRQKQSLISIYWRINNLGNATFSDVVGDTGVAFATMAGHLRRLRDKQLIQCRGEPINMTFDDDLVLTEQGNEIARSFLDKIGSSVNDPIDVIHSKLKVDYEGISHSPSNGFNLNSRSTFSKSYNDLIKERNLTEPVITSIALYTELDSQLNLLKETDKPTYLSLTKNKLNLEIRCGRLSSIAIPIMLRGYMPHKELKNILESSWSWLNTVRNIQIIRYMNEATSLGLIQQRSGIVTSLKPSATDIVSWLAAKTGDTFLNTVNIAPKASLLVFREAFNYPTEEELLSPNISNSLPWAQKMYDDLDRDIYLNSMNEAIDILVNKAKIVERIEGGKLVPRTIMRNIKDGKDIENTFRTILKSSQEENNSIATILLSITAKPGITIEELYRNLKSSVNISISTVENIVSNLANRGLVHIARSTFSRDSSTIKLYAFSHIPFIKPKFSGEDRAITEANAVIKGMEPWILSSIKDFFPEYQEKKYLYNILSGLLKNKEITFDDIEKEYGKTMTRKLGAWSYTLNPFIESDKNYSFIKISNTQLGNIILDILQYSLLTTNDALDIYASAISNIVSRDINVITTIENDASTLKNKFMKMV